MMKSKVLERPLFKGKKGAMSEDEASNVGIMDGFMESMMDGEMDDNEPEDDEYKSEKILGRSPDSPEILMNNLRGDMRSVDARVEELADMVGIRAAQDTPQEVLALLQPVLAGQAAPPAMPPGGIAGLPAGMPPAGETPPMPMGGEAPMMPPMPMEGGAPAEMPPEAAGGIGSLPTGQEAPAPMGMAQGGYVQRFQQGSDEEGVTPSTVDNATYAYSPEMIQQAQSEIAKLLAEKPVAPPSLNQAMASRIPQYKAILGGSKDLTQAQMLFDLAGGFLNVAAGIDAEGRPIRGAPSSAMRLAAGLKNVPAMVGARAAEFQKSDRDVKMMAMQAGEKDIAAAREYNYKLIDGQRKIWTEIIKADAKAKGTTAKGMFGTGLKAQAWDFLTKNAPNFAAGTLTPDQDRAFSTSFAVVNEPQYYQDEVTGKWLSRRPDIPSFITDAFNQRNKIPVPAKGKVSAADTLPPAVPVTPTSRAAPVATMTDVQPPAMAVSPAADKTTVAPPAATPMAANARKSPTLWQLTGVLTGPIPTVKDVVSSIPGFGNVGKEVTQARSRFMGDFRELVKALQNSPVYAQGERKSIESELDIEPRFFDDPAKLRNKLVGIDDYLLGRYNDSKTNATNSNLPAKDRQEYLRIGKLIENFRPKLGVPVRVYSIDEVNKLPPNTPFLWNGTDARVKN
jgi:hypothetical protein